MRIRGKRKGETITLQMTAMIDIVFQLLVYFIMTFKVTALEGDFFVNMPTASKENQPQDFLKVDNTIYVQLRKNSDNGIGAIEVTQNNETSVFASSDMYTQLRGIVKQAVLAESDPASAEEIEVEFSVDYDLHYDATVRAIEAVSGEVNPNGTISTLAQKIRFKDTRQGGL